MLDIQNVGKSYQAVQAIKDVAFSVKESEFVCVVGPSGCGKTTLLKCMSGLLAPTTGKVVINGKTVTSPPPEMGMVFQDYRSSLYPWSTVWDNIMLPLRPMKLSKAERDDRVQRALSNVRLEKFRDHYPWQLSGGMQQRIAIARALAYRPQILLMDEPFASVDAQTRAELEDLTLEVKRKLGKTVLLVTHDIDESVYLADRIVVLSKSPTVVREIIPVDLPHPRDQVTTKELPEFAHLRAQVYRLIHEAGQPVAA